ncbi:MAG: uroporphyrinogen decarboxylase family protein, partial [Kiritimatiellota bacterium]|nr:uroporphyrinogen decarboxylase family protein [Kiritimatiellota bacterium]
AGLAQIHDYNWPNPAWMDVSRIRLDALAWNRQYAILGGDWSAFWHDAIDLLGMENLYLKMYDEPGLVDALMRHLADYYAEVSRRIFEAAGNAMDIFFMGNDFGGQMGPLLSPELFERFILPHLKRLIRLGHDYRLKVQLHCCGGYEPLLPLLINAELDAVHAVQPGCVGMDLAKLKEKYGRRMVFNGAIDSHHILIDGTPDLVRQKTREVLGVMMPGGGYIAGASHDTIMEETPVENILAMCDMVRDAGVYQKPK